MWSPVKSTRDGLWKRQQLPRECPGVCTISTSSAACPRTGGGRPGGSGVFQAQKGEKQPWISLLSSPFSVHHMDGTSTVEPALGRTSDMRHGPEPWSFTSTSRVVWWICGDGVAQ